MKLYLDLLTTLKVTHAESPIVIFFGTYGIFKDFHLLNKPTKNRPKSARRFLAGRPQT